MNRIERIVYDCVKASPKLKRTLVRVYQFSTSLVPPEKFVSKYRPVVRENFFFGFHDKIPWCPDNQRLLAHKILQSSRKIGKSDQVEIGFFSGSECQDFNPIASCNAWNWQQGSMLQWVGDSGNFLFNDSEGGQNVSRIYDTNGRLLKTLSRAVGAISPSGGYALSYSFERLRQGMPGYGYEHGVDPFHNVLAPEGGDLALIDLQTENVRPLFSIAEIAGLHPEPSMEGAFHFFTHCLFAPDSQRFVFFHRWHHGPDKKLWTRMLSADLSGKNIHVFPNDGMVSHISWYDKNHILAYSNVKQGKDAYYLFTDKSEEFEMIGNNYFTSDGHPQFATGKHYFVTDTYPNRRRVKQLMVFDMERQQGNLIAKVYLPFKYRDEFRIDLHPRWDRLGKQICFDAGYVGKRSLCTINLADEQGNYDVM